MEAVEGAMGGGLEPLGLRSPLETYGLEMVARLGVVVLVGVVGQVTVGLVCIRGCDAEE